MPIEAVDPAQAFIEAARAAEEAKAVLVARLDAIKSERKDAVARWKAEAHQIRQLLGRTRRTNGTKPKVTRTRKARAEAASATA